MLAEPESPLHLLVSPEGSVYTNSEIDDDAYGEELSMFRSSHPTYEDRKRAVHEDYGFDESIVVLLDEEKDDFYVGPNERFVLLENKEDFF